MTAKATAAVLLVTLGSVAAFAVTNAPGDPPIRLSQATVYVTVTERHVVLYQGHGTRWWAHRAVRARRAANESHRTAKALRSHLRARWAPTVDYGLRLARATFGIDQTRRAWCESRFDPFATNGQYNGILQFGGSTWRSTPFGSFSIWDPIAQALAGGWMVTHGRSGEWACRL